MSGTERTEAKKGRRAYSGDSSGAGKPTIGAVQPPAESAVERTRAQLAAAACALADELGRPARVLVGMSGGVDSSVAAALLAEAGFNVTGAYMKNWILDVPGMRCPWADDLADAKRVAVRLGIDFRVYDFQDVYKRDVVDYLVGEYKAGRTPNPDIMCNQDVKFGVFLDAAEADGFDLIATGHYARTSLLTNPRSVCQLFKNVTNRPRVCQQAQLLRAADVKKDQTYFLYRMQQRAVARTLFPLGGLQKTQVRALAEEFGLQNAEKPDSQGICFVGEAGIREFLSLYVQPAPGPIVDDETGETVGYHDGAINFTIGQRKGLGIGGGAQYYVSRKDMETNTVYVRNGKAAKPRERGLRLQNLAWIAGTAPAAGDYLVRTHHGEALQEARISFSPGTAADEKQAEPECLVAFTQPRETVAPGQSVVIYDGETCLGGGIVA